MNLKFAKILMQSSLQDEGEQLDDSKGIKPPHSSENHTVEERPDNSKLKQVINKTLSIENEDPTSANSEDHENDSLFLEVTEKDLTIKNPSNAWQNIMKLLEIYPNGHLHQFKDGTTLLMIFCHYPEAVEYLLKNGSDPNAVDARGFSVVMHAISCQAPSAEVLDMLIKAGASLKMSESRHQPCTDIFSFALKQYAPPLELNNRLPAIAPALEFLFRAAKSNGVTLPDFYTDIFASLLKYNWDTSDEVLARTCLNIMASPFFNPAKLYALPIEKPDQQDSLGSYMKLCGLSLMGLIDTDYIFVNALGLLLNTCTRNRIADVSSILVQGLKKTVLLDVEGEGVVSPGLLMLYLYFQKKTSPQGYLSNNKDLLQNVYNLKGLKFPTYPSHHLNGLPEFLRHVPIELVLTHLLVYVETQEECVELYKSLLAYCPVHPFALHSIDNTLKSKSANASFRSACKKNSKIVERVTDYIGKACGVKVGGIMNTSGKEGPFFSSKLENRSPASLKVMSIWASRMAIATTRVTKSLSLPAYIKWLGDNGILPKGLACDLLVFPPTKVLPY